MKAGLRALALTLGVVSTSAVHATPREPDAKLHDYTVQGDRPTMRFISVTPELVATAKKPGVMQFSTPDDGTARRPGEMQFGKPNDATTRVSRLVGMPYGEIALFRRGPAVGESKVDEEAPWEIQIVAALSPRNVKGNVMFVMYDREDPTAPERHAYAALWETTMDPFRVVAARFVLDPKNEGFHATHTYLFRIIQVWNKREVVLAQGTFRLE